MKIKKLVNVFFSIILSSTALLSISVSTVSAATFNCVWTDASGSDNNFSTAGNWAGCNGTAPGVTSDIYNLTFPSSAFGFDPVNDIASLTVGSISFSGNFSGSGYQISSSSSSNVISVNDGISDSSSGTTAGNEIDGNLTLTATQTFTTSSTTRLVIGLSGDTLDIGANTLTVSNTTFNGSVSGSGTININDTFFPSDTNGVDLTSDNSSFTGSVNVQVGALFVDNASSLTAATSVTVNSGALLKGNGGLSSSTIQSGGTLAPGHSPGCLSFSSVTLNGTLTDQIGGTIACADYDQLNVSGNADISNSTLQVSFVNGFSPSVGQTFTIINNTGSSPITGTFNGLSEGSTFTSGGVTFSISYIGGSGNSVVLTVVSSASGSGSTPASPNTGSSIKLANPLIILAATLICSSSLILLSRKISNT